MVASEAVRRAKILVGVLAVAGLGVWLGCASSQGQPQAEEQNRLTGVDVEREGDASLVTLVGLTEPVYTASLDPVGKLLVLDLAGVNSVGAMTPNDPWMKAEAVGPKLVYDGIVEHVALSSYGDPEIDISTRVEVALAGDADYEIQNGSRGLTLRVWLRDGAEAVVDESDADLWSQLDSEEAADVLTDELVDELAAADDAAAFEEETVLAALSTPVAPATAMLSAVHETASEGVLIYFKADGAIETMETFTLENPDRLVIDLPGIENKVSSPSLKIASGPVSQVRFGAHPGKTRVVVDGRGSGDGFSARSVVPVSDGLVISIGTGADLEEMLAQATASATVPSLVAATDPGFEEEISFGAEVEGDAAFEDELAELEALTAGEEVDPFGTSEFGTQADVAEPDVDPFSGDEFGSQELAASEEPATESSGESSLVMGTSSEPVKIYGINFDSSNERDRIAILSEAPVDYQLFKPDSETLVISFTNASIAGEAEGRIERELGGPTSLISAFQQPDVDSEVRLVVTRAPGLEPVISRQGTMLFLDFPNTGVAAAPAPASEAAHLAVADTPELSGGSQSADLSNESAPASIASTSGLPSGDADALATGMNDEWVPAALNPLDAAQAALPSDATLPAHAGAPASLEPPAAIEVLEEGGLIDGKAYMGRRISLDFKDVGVADVLRLIAEVSDLNIIAGSEVSGNVTIRLVDVPWDQALDVILLTKGLGFVRVGNVLRIAPADVLKVEEEVRLQERRNREKLEDLEVKLLPVNYAAAKDVLGMVKRLLSARGTVDIDNRTNTIIIKDISSVIEEAASLVLALDTETPQVVIEAKVVEAGLDFRRELGSTWGIQTNQYEDAFLEQGVNRSLGGEDVRFINENSLVFSNPISSSPTAALTMGALLLDEQFNVDVSLQAVESMGDGKVISSPRIVTLDNRPAKISQGVSIPFQTFESGDAKLEFIDAVLSLEVTPHVTANKSIIMAVTVTRNAPDDSVATPTGSPAIAKNEAETETLVKDGQTMVIGGIYTIVKSERHTRVPFLHKMPVIGNAFKNMSVTDTRKELLVFVTPRIVQ